MKNIVVKCAAVCILMSACVALHTQDNDQYDNDKSSPQIQQQQEQQQRQPRRQRFGASRYDPNAGLYQSQLSSHGVIDGFKKSINPCNRNFGVVMDGWQDAGIDWTVRNTVWWMAMTFLIALGVVVFDDWFRMQQARDTRVAFASAALLLLNDRAYCLRKANEAIYRHNMLIEKIDKMEQEAEARGQLDSYAETHDGAIQGAEKPASSATQSTPAAPLPALQSASPAHVAEPENESPTGEPAGSDDASSVDNVKMTTLNLGGKKYMVAAPIQLVHASQTRKIENQRQQINQLEERLRQYEKD